MGATIVVLCLATLAVALRFLREPGRDRADGDRRPARARRDRWSACSVGFVMVAVSAATPSACPTAARACRWSAGAPPAATCGSRTSSGCTPCRCCRCSPPRSPRRGRLDVRPGARVVRVVGGRLHRRWSLLLTWQALRGQPLLAPDALTLGVTGGLVLGSAAAAVIVLARRSATPAPVDLTHQAGGPAATCRRAPPPGDSGSRATTRSPPPSGRSRHSVPPASSTRAGRDRQPQPRARRRCSAPGCARTGRWPAPARRARDPGPCRARRSRPRPSRRRGVHA